MPRAFAIPLAAVPWARESPLDISVEKFPSTPSRKLFTTPEFDKDPLWLPVTRPCSSCWRTGAPAFEISSLIPAVMFWTMSPKSCPKSPSFLLKFRTIPDVMLVKICWRKVPSWLSLPDPKLCIKSLSIISILGGVCTWVGAGRDTVKVVVVTFIVVRFPNVVFEMDEACRGVTVVDILWGLSRE